MELKKKNSTWRMANMTVLFRYGKKTGMNLGVESRKITYTTNVIENLNREIGRVTKTKGDWTSDKALLIQLPI